MSKEDNQKVYFGDKKVEKLEKKEGVESISVSYTHLRAHET